MARAVGSFGCEPHLVNLGLLQVGREGQLPGTAGRSYSLGFRTGGQAAGNACTSSGTEVSGMVLL